MIIYILFLTTIFGLMFIEKLNILPSIQKSNSNNRDTNFNSSVLVFPDNKFNVAIIIAWLTIFTFSSFRFNVGWDYLAYYNTIKYDIVTNIVSNGEYATILLIELAKKLELTNLYFFLNALISLSLFAKTIKDYSKNQWVSIIFFVCFPLFFLNSLSVIRIFTALSIIFYGFKFIEKSQPFKYLLIVLIAGMFHTSAFIAIFFYFIRNLKLNTFKTIIILFLLPLASSISNKLIINYLPKYGVYTQSTNIQEGTKAIYVLLLIGVFALILRKKIIKLDQTANIYYNIYFVGLAIYLMFLSQGTMGHRLSLYGTIFSLLLIPKMISLVSIRKDRILILTVFFFLCLIFFLYTIQVGYETYIPYKTIFQLQ